MWFSNPKSRFKIPTMMKHSRELVMLGIGLGFMSFACATAPTPKSVSPSPTTEQLDEEVTAPQTASVATSEDDASESATSNATSKPEESNEARSNEGTRVSEAFPIKKPSRIDLMLGGATAYLIDWQRSGALELAKSNCTPKNLPMPPADETQDQADQRMEEQAKKFDECLLKARERFVADVLRFRRDGLGHVEFVVYRRDGSALKELYVGKVELDQKSTETLKVDVKGASLGQRPIMRDRNQFEIRMPNSYSIELEDPQYGKLYYDEKVGLVAR